MSALAYTTTQPPTQAISCPHSMTGDESSILTDIYQDDINIVIWQRELASMLTQAVNYILKTKPVLQISITATPDNAYAAVNEALGATQLATALSEDITKLVGIFCNLFELERAGLRLTTLDHTMCPRFHVDRIPCRLVTTYQGAATQWLPHRLVDRSKLSSGNQGKPDEQSGLFEKTDAIIQQLNQGDVALLKGECWKGNEGAGLVHRSPQLANDARRLLLTLDFTDDLIR